MDESTLPDYMQSFKKMIGVTINAFNDDLVGDCLECFENLQFLLILIKNMSKLPQELVDMIRDFVFTANPSLRYLDHFAQKNGLEPSTAPRRPYCPRPDRLQLLLVNKETSAQFAKSFFETPGTVFIADGLHGPASNLCAEWFSSLTRDHHCLVKDVRGLALRKGEDPQNASTAGNSSYTSAKESELRGKFRETGMNRVLHLGDEEGELTADLNEYVSRNPSYRKPAPPPPTSRVLSSSEPEASSERPDQDDSGWSEDEMNVAKAKSFITAQQQGIIVPELETQGDSGSAIDDDDVQDLPEINQEDYE